MTDITLEKIDLVRERTGASYQQAVEYLTATDGNVIEAIIAFEKDGNKTTKVEEIEVAGNKLLEKVKQLIHEGNITKITIKKDDEVLLNIPVNLGIAAVVLSPYLAVFAGIAVFSSSCTILVERKI